MSKLFGAYIETRPNEDISATSVASVVYVNEVEGIIPDWRSELAVTGIGTNGITQLPGGYIINGRRIFLPTPATLPLSPELTGSKNYILVHRLDMAEPDGLVDMVLVEESIALVDYAENDNIFTKDSTGKKDIYMSRIVNTSSGVTSITPILQKVKTFKEVIDDTLDPIIGQSGPGIQHIGTFGFYESTTLDGASIGIRPRYGPNSASQFINGILGTPGIPTTGTIPIFSKSTEFTFDPVNQHIIFDKKYRFLEVEVNYTIASTNSSGEAALRARYDNAVNINVYRDETESVRGTTVKSFMKAMVSPKYNEGDLDFGYIDRVRFSLDFIKISATASTGSTYGYIKITGYYFEEDN